MAQSTPWQLRVSQQLDDAARAWCDEHEVTLSELIRSAVADAIDQPELLETVRKPGRPANTLDTTEQ